MHESRTYVPLRPKVLNISTANTICMRNSYSKWYTGYIYCSSATWDWGQIFLVLGKGGGGYPGCPEWSWVAIDGKWGSHFWIEVRWGKGSTGFWELEPRSDQKCHKLSWPSLKYIIRTRISLPDIQWNDKSVSMRWNKRDFWANLKKLAIKRLKPVTGKVSFTSIHHVVYLLPCLAVATVPWQEYGEITEATLDLDILFFQDFQWSHSE